MSKKKQKQQQQDETPQFGLSQLRGGSAKIAKAATRYMNALNIKKEGGKNV